MAYELVADSKIPRDGPRYGLSPCAIRPASQSQFLGVATLPMYRLYHPSSVLIASLFGGPLSVGLLLAANYRKRAQNAASRKALFLGVLGTILLAYLDPLLHLASLDLSIRGLGIAAVVALQQIAQQLQGKKINHHKAVGDELYSHWRALPSGWVA